MKTTKACHLTCLLFCLAINLIFATDDTKDEVSVEKKSDGDNFFAARGRRSSDTSNGAASPYDLFWANRGKRSPGSNHVKVERDQGNFNVPRPNGFFFPSEGKRASNYNIPRPNGFFFPSAGKRASNYNIPRPNGFFFPSAGKRASNYNIPRPRWILRPDGKRASSYNIPRPNGFFFPASTGKSNDDLYLPNQIISSLKMERQMQRRSQGWSKAADSSKSWAQWPYIKPRLI